MTDLTPAPLGGVEPPASPIYADLYNKSKLPLLVQKQLEGFSVDQNLTFDRLYLEQAKKVELMVLLAIVFPIQMLLLKKVGLWFAFFLTGGGFGLWWIAEWFVTPSRVRHFNNQVAMDIATQVKTLGA